MSGAEAVITPEPILHLMGEAAALLMVDAGDRIEVLGPTPHAPGQPIELLVQGMKLRGKCRGSRRQADGRFRIGVQLVCLRREQRDQLRAMACGTEASAE